VRNKDLRIFYSSLHVMRMVEFQRMRWIGHAESTREMRNAYILVGKCEGMALA
jgi:hypothetical protein